METNSKGKRMVFEEDIKYLQELKGENISSKTVGRVVDTDNITTLSDEVCNALKCGDMVNKVDSTGKHSYRVSYKKDEVGMCLTYSDASCVETVSYDYTEGHWVYNSTDVTEIPGSSGGDQLYKHTLFVGASMSVALSKSVINSSPIALTSKNDIIDLLFDDGYVISKNTSNNPIFATKTTTQILAKTYAKGEDNVVIETDETITISSILDAMCIDNVTEI